MDGVSVLEIRLELDDEPTTIELNALKKRLWKWAQEFSLYVEGFEFKYNGKDIMFG